MPKVIDLTGQYFGRLEVIRYDHTEKSGKYWLCHCECGNTKVIKGSLLQNGHTRSCGCLVKERGHEMLTKHGLYNVNPKLHNVWNSMKERCNNPKHHAYENYGGRGIKVCDVWQHDFKAFLEWSMANGYAEGLTIDRINVNGNYEPSNCRWATQKQQANNTRRNKFYEFNGKKQTVTQWAEEKGIGKTTLDSRLKAGWSFEKAITTPIDTRFRPGYMKGAN